MQHAEKQVVGFLGERHLLIAILTLAAMAFPLEEGAASGSDARNSVGRAVAAARPYQYRICRKIRDSLECVEITEGCQGGLIVLQPDAVKRPQCREMSCSRLKERFVAAAAELEELSAPERNKDPTEITCNGFILDEPGHTISACIGQQRQGAALLLKHFIALMESC